MVSITHGPGVYPFKYRPNPTKVAEGVGHFSNGFVLAEQVSQEESIYAVYGVGKTSGLVACPGI
jgi:hypothetical protein